MADATKYGNPTDYDVDFHSIYAAFLGDFDARGVDWWDSTWGGYFNDFGSFLGFGWEAMVVVDSVTGRAHVAGRRDQIAQFARMIKTRFGETLDKDPPTLLPLRPVQSRTRALHRLVTLVDLASYRKLCASLAPAELAHLRARVRAGEEAVVRALFYAGGAGEPETRGARHNGRGYTWAAVKTTWWEKGGAPQGVVPGHGRTAMARPGQGGKALVLEVGVAALRCANLRAVDVWPPVPERNYRKAHYITEEWVDKRTNVDRPSYPRAYGFGKSQFVAERSVERILESTLSGLASQEADNSANTLVLVTAGELYPLPLPASSTVASNVLHVDILQLEWSMYQGAVAQGMSTTDGRQGPLASLRQLLQVLQVPVPHHVPLGNAGNDAFYTLLALQKLLLHETRLPDLLFPQAAPDYAAYGASPYAMPYAAYQPFPQPGPSPAAAYSPPLPPPIRDADPRRMSSSSLARTAQDAAARRASQSSILPTAAGAAAPRSRPTSIQTPPAEPPRALRNVDSGTGSLRGAMPRQPGMPRSQTVYWDDPRYAADADAGQGHARDESAHERAERMGRAPLRPSLTGDARSRSAGPLHMAAAGTAPPPSSLRASSSHVQMASAGASGRAVSFHEERRPPPSSFTPPPPPVGGQAAHDRTQSPARMGRADATPPLTSSSSRADLATGCSRTNLAGGSPRPRRTAAAGSKDSTESKGSSNDTTASGSGSAASADSSSMASPGKGKDGKATKTRDKDGGSGKKGSVKDIRGALARFWVG